MSDNNTKWEPHEQVNLRYRLMARAIRINGLAQIRTLQGFMQSRLARTLEGMIEPQLDGESMCRSSN